MFQVKIRIVSCLTKTRKFYRSHKGGQKRCIAHQLPGQFWEQLPRAAAGCPNDIVAHSLIPMIESLKQIIQNMSRGNSWYYERPLQLFSFTV